MVVYVVVCLAAQLAASMISFIVIKPCKKYQSSNVRLVPCFIIHPKIRKFVFESCLKFLNFLKIKLIKISTIQYVFALLVAIYVQSVNVTIYVSIIIICLLFLFLSNPSAFKTQHITNGVYEVSVRE